MDLATKVKPDAAELTAESILEDFSVDEGTFDIELPNGKILHVKKIRSIEDMTAIQQKSEEFRGMRGKDVPAKWVAYLPKGTEISQQAATIMAQITVLVVSPKFTALQALRLCMAAGPVAAYIHQQILASTVANVSKAEAQEIDAEKNDLPEESTEHETSVAASSGETTSPSDVTTSVSTPTNSPEKTGSGHES